MRNWSGLEVPHVNDVTKHSFEEFAPLRLQFTILLKRTLKRFQELAHMSLTAWHGTELNLQVWIVFKEHTFYIKETNTFH